MVSVSTVSQTSPLTFRSPELWTLPLLALLGMIVVFLILQALTKKKPPNYFYTSRAWKRIIISAQALASLALALVIEIADLSEWYSAPALPPCAPKFIAWGLFFLFVVVGGTLYSWHYDDRLEEAIEEVGRVEKTKEAMGRTIENTNERSIKIGKIVGAKATAIRKYAQSEPKDVLVEFVGALQPKNQYGAIIAQLHETLEANVMKRLDGTPAAIKAQQSTHSVLRLAYFVVAKDKSRLLVDESYDGKNWDFIKLPSSKEHVGRFVFGDPKMSLAKHASEVGSIHPIEDTGQIPERYRDIYVPFDNKQKSKIRSIVAFACEVSDRGPYAVICVDSSIPNFFSTDNYPMELLIKDFQEFGQRLRYETDMLKSVDMVCDGVAKQNKAARKRGQADASRKSSKEADRIVQDPSSASKKVVKKAVKKKPRAQDDRIT